MVSHYMFTAGWEALTVEERNRAAMEFIEKRADHRRPYYWLNDGRIYAQENATGGFTFMLAEEC